MSEILPEIQEQILVRLDITDLIRCKSVCKSWKSLISRSHFIKAHLIRSYINDHNSNEIGDRRIVIADLPVCLSLSHGQMCDWFLESRHCTVVGSSNGLVCLFIYDHEFLIVNPATRDVKTLTSMQYTGTSPWCMGFGYDVASDDYKVVLGVRNGKDQTCFIVLMLKSNEWKFVREVNYTRGSFIGTLCNGALHWLMNDQNKNKVILSFDLSEHEFNEIPHPGDLDFKFCVIHALGIVKGCLCIHLQKSQPHDLWIMKSYKVKESWEMVGRGFDIKYQAVHCLRHVNQDIPHELLYTTWVVLLFPIYVQSLVSPHISGTVEGEAGEE